MPTIRCGLRAALLALFVAGVAAGQDGPKQYTLEECIAIGLKNNPDLSRSRNEIDRSYATKRRAFGDFLPTLGVSGSWTRSSQKMWTMTSTTGAMQTEESFSYGLGADLTLFNGLSNFYTADRSILGVQASEQGAMRSEQTVVFTVQSGYYNLLRLRQLVTVNRSNLERSTKQLDRIKELNAVGSVPLADVYRQQVQVGRDELTLLQAENTYRNALVDLQNVLGLDPREDFEISGNDVPDAVTDDDIARDRAALPAAESLLAEALKHRADYRQAELSLRGADRSVQVARAGHYPQLSAFAQYGWTNNVFQWGLLTDSDLGRFSYGLSLNIPIFSRFSVSAAVESAEIDRLNAETSVRELRRTIAAELQKASNELAAAEKNLEITRRTLLSAKEDHRIASERYALGAGTLLDLIVANSNLTSAQSDLINATFNYLVVRRQVEYQLGSIAH
jgi:outer membrane protein